MIEKNKTYKYENLEKIIIEAEAETIKMLSEKLSEDDPKEIATNVMLVTLIFGIFNAELLGGKK